MNDEGPKFKMNLKLENLNMEKPTIDPSSQTHAREPQIGAWPETCIMTNDLGSPIINMSDKPSQKEKTPTQLVESKLDSNIYDGSKKSKKRMLSANIQSKRSIALDG